uniref:Uncharacterized protein n=1 Tax=Anopheles culicifacies TaxID=139723 RepID=A0A182M4E6_9DIPT
MSYFWRALAYGTLLESEPASVKEKLTIFFCVVFTFITPVVTRIPSACSLRLAGTMSWAAVSASSCFSCALRRARAACLASNSSISWSMSCRRAFVALARLLAYDSAVSSFHLSAWELLATEDVSVLARI